MTLQEFFWSFGYYGNDPTTPFSRDWVDCIGISGLAKVQRRIKQLSKATQLYKDIMIKFGSNSHELSVIADCTKQYTMGRHNISPDTLIILLKAMGFNTWEQLAHWITDADYTLFTLKGAFNCIRPPCPNLGELEKFSLHDVRRRIRDACPGIHPFKLYNMDNKYRYVPENKIQEIINACPIHRLVGQQERLDCDDFTRAMMGWLSENGQGNITIGRMVVTLSNSPNPTIGTGAQHALCFAITVDRKMFVIEPQKTGEHAWYRYTPDNKCAFQGWKYLTPTSMEI